MEQRIICKDCHGIFILTDEEQREKLRQNWDIPVRCPDCRWKRRAFADWRETMYHPKPARKRNSDFSFHLYSDGYGHRW